MERAAGIVLAGGRSSRMGQPKAALPWHGQTLLERVAGILKRCALDPVVVVRAPRQQLPSLPRGVEVVEDACEGRGPLEALASGLRAIESRADVAFVSSTDLPFLQPSFVTTVLHGLDDGAEIAIPRADGRLHPLPAAYRTSVRARADALLAAGRTRLTELLEQATALALSEDDLRAVDPELRSLRNLNLLVDYEAALAEPLPAVRIEHAVEGGGVSVNRSIVVRAATLGAATDAMRIGPTRRFDYYLNGARVPEDRALPLVPGDTLLVVPAANAPHSAG